MGGTAPAKQAFAGVPFLRLFEGHLRLSFTHRETNRPFCPRFASPCSMGRNARGWVQLEFSAEHLAEQTAMVYREALTG